MKFSLLIPFLFSCILLAQSQNVPQGMKYQAVARDDAGELLANEDITLQITLHDATSSRSSYYVEVHEVRTDRFGLFTLTVGNGSALRGSFDKIPWYEGDIYMAVAIRDRTSDSLVTLSDSRLLSVPYALHAATASDIRYNVSGRDPTPGVNAQTWSLFGNYATNDNKDRLGTTDAQDLVIITNNVERMRVSSDGDVMVVNDLYVGSDVQIDSTLTAGHDVELNTEGGNTTVHGDFTVENMSSTHLTGTLEVDKTTTLNDSLTVENEAPAYLTGSLVVDGAAKFGKELSVEGTLNLNDSLTVHNMAPTHLTGKLDVDKDLTVEGTSTLNDDVSIAGSIDVTHESTGFIASYTNTNDGPGDGITISLGKTHPRWNGAMVQVPLPGVGFLDDVLDDTKTLIKGVLESPGSFGPDDFKPIGETLVTQFENTGQDIENIASAACLLTNDVIAEVNGTIEGIGTDDFDVGQELLEELNDIADAFIDDDWIDDIEGDVVVPGFSIPGIPTLNCPNQDPNFSFTMPNVALSDVSNSLDNDNQFIQFTDKDGRQLGSVRAESITNWCDRYLDLAYFMTVINSFVGVTEISVDPVALGSTAFKYGVNGVTIMFNAVQSYNSIGVEYSSGFGDYAEWLERANPEESISSGDIVGVRGGKISKDLTGAEQVMAASFKPIVLGNTPPAEREHLGNKVAFMGQIPVKVIGPVKTGDFIVGTNDVPGYGIAIAAEDMTPEDFACAVGRSWEDHPGDGPKMVNTVIGVHNGDYMHILKDFQQRLNETDARLSAIERKLDMFMPDVQAASYE